MESCFYCYRLLVSIDPFEKQIANIEDYIQECQGFECWAVVIKKDSNSERRGCCNLPT